MTRSPGAERRRQVRDLNDAFRRSFSGGRVVVTAGIAVLPEAMRAAVLTAVRAFDAFNANNDPHGEHDFGVVSVSDVHVLWKIDAYDLELHFASPDPVDPAVTVRVLTIMLAEEY